MRVGANATRNLVRFPSDQPRLCPSLVEARRRLDLRLSCLRFEVNRHFVHFSKLHPRPTTKIFRRSSLMILFVATLESSLFPHLRSVCRKRPVAPRVSRALVYHLVAIATKFCSSLSRGAFAGAPWADLLHFARGALFWGGETRKIGENPKKSHVGL